MESLLDAASINGVPLHHPGEQLTNEALRQRACTELLRQAAIEAGLLGADDPLPTQGATSVAATQAIEALLDRALQLPDPDEDTCRRYHAAHQSQFAVGERVCARHVLFAVTPGVDVGALRQRAESCLLELRCQGPDGGERFSQAAARWSNCPSGAEGGDLGWLDAQGCAPEFASALFGHHEIGVLPHLVHTRFGLHVVEVLARQPGDERPFEAVRDAVAQALRRQAFTTALRQYVQLLAGQAEIAGLTLDAASMPLVQ
jgi:peptidyl-prolyl cis-trans isomerase C